MKKWTKITVAVVSALVVTMSAVLCVFAAPKLKDLIQSRTSISSEIQESEEADSSENETKKTEKNVNNTVKNSSRSSADGATEIVTTDMESIAAGLKENSSKIATIEMSDSNSQVKISSAGIYLITGSCSNGNITVKKGTTGVVLILKDLDLTSRTGATVSINKGSIVKMIIQGTVNLTDAENPDDENSSDAETADAFDGAVIKVKAGADLYICGDGTLNLDASSCKNGIKSNDDPSTICIIDGPTINIEAANDAINSGYDLSILSGTITINAGDDAIHADRILTIGSEDSSPVINIESSKEGLEGTVVNIINGDITVNANDDAINAGNSDATYESEMEYSINVLGGTTVVNSKGDGLDSNGNINLIAGSLTINCNNNGGEGGIDYNDSYYISDDMDLTNNGGITFDSGTDGFGGFGGGNFDKNQFGSGEKSQLGGNQKFQFGNGKMPEFEDGEKPEFGDGEMPQFGDGERPQMPEGFEPGRNGQRTKKSGTTEDSQAQ